MLLSLQIIADIYAPNIPNIYTQIPHARVIGSLNCSQFSDLRTAEFIVDSGASFTTLLPYHVVMLGINWQILPYASIQCTTATGDRVNPRLLQDVELHINKNDGKPNSEEIFILPYIHVMPPSLQEQIPRSYSLLGMDVLRNFPNWHWDFDKMCLFLSHQTP